MKNLRGWENDIKAAQNEAPSHASWFEEAMINVSWPQQILLEQRPHEEPRSLGVWLCNSPCEDMELKSMSSLPLLQAPCIAWRSVPRQSPPFLQRICGYF